MNSRRISSFALAIALCIGAPSLAGCGHSEEEWQAELGKEKKLQADLDAERAAHQKTAAELKKTQAEVDQLKKDLEAFEDLKKQFGNEKDKAAKLEKALADAEARAKALEAAKKRLEALKKFNLKVTVRHNQIVIELPGDVLFAPGSELLSKEGKEVILKVAEVLKGDPDLMKRYYQVAGHTDNAPYGGAFKDNVGLSVMRAREVYSFLTAPTDASATPKKGAKAAEGGGGLPADHWSAAGYGDLDPVAGTRESQTPEEKKRNRRVEIAILPDASELMKLDVE